MVEDELFRHSATHQLGQSIFHVNLIIGEAVLYWQRHCYPEGTAAGDNAHLVYRIRFGEKFGYQGMADLMKGGVALFFLTHDHALALGTHEDLIFSQLQV